MKKLCLVFVILALAVIPSMVMAGYDQHVSDDGITVWGISDPTDKALVNDDTIFRGKYTQDTNGKDQKLSLNVNLSAYIPCYISMKVVGNQGASKLESFGPKAEATGTIPSTEAGNYMIVFDNEVGGFVDANWNSIGHGSHAEIAPGTGAYIKACDQFKVEVYSNDTFTYSVKGAALTSTNADLTSSLADKSLQLDMRTSIGNKTSWGGTVSFTSTTEAEYSVAKKNACETVTAYHEFRVPYKTTTAHGEWTGKIVFYAATI
ncbi:MAG TPA: hypothetical protein VHR47_13300 [Bacillota bacterium]|nr:hypothetical protein [Bacillota bacterium]